MNDFGAPGLVYGALALAAVVLYGAWHEHTANNHRDAKLLAALGAVTLVGSVVVWLP